jgi:hypothetical protein
MLFHNPVVLAKRFATLDVLSEGRAICGLGIGWFKDEYQVAEVAEKRELNWPKRIFPIALLWTNHLAIIIAYLVCALGLSTYL